MGQTKVFTAGSGEDTIVTENNKADSSFAHHMLDTTHKSESTKNALDAFHVTNRGKCRNITKRFTSVTSAAAVNY